MFRLIRVSGQSMSPTLSDGDIVITIKPRRLRAGLIYVVNHSDIGIIIKRLSEFDERGRAVLRGDNARSTSSTVMGTVERERLTRRALFVLGKAGFRKL